MSVRFVDTNVLLYAISKDRAERAKSNQARQLLTETDLALSTQVLQEFYVHATRASRADRISEDQAKGLVRSFLRFPVQPIDSGIVLAAIDLQSLATISYWDAAIIEAARASGCESVLSEDLNDGQDYQGVVVENPFV